MNVLAIDTATELCSVALSINGEIHTVEQLDPTGHSRLVLSMVERLMVGAGLNLTQLDLLATDVGPGSFTGMRIGLGVCQGLAYGAGLPVLGVHSLAALASQVEHGGPILAAIDARMGQVYWGLYTGQEGVLELEGELGLCAPSELPAIDTVVTGVGSAWDQYFDVLLDQVTVKRWLPLAYPHARDIVRWAMRSQKSNFLEAAQLMPVYLRNDIATVGKRQPLLAKLNQV